jgi:hypothetical protein
MPTVACRAIFFQKKIPCLSHFARVSKHSKPPVVTSAVDYIIISGNLFHRLGVQQTILGFACSPTARRKAPDARIPLVAIILLSAHLYRKQMLEMDKRLFHKGVRIRAASDVENEVQPIDKTSLAQAEGIRENK